MRDSANKTDYASSYVSFKKSCESIQTFKRKLEESGRVAVGDFVLYWFDTSLRAYFGQSPKGVPLQVVYVHPRGIFYIAKSAAGICYTIAATDAVTGCVIRLADKKLDAVRKLWLLTKDQREQLVCAIMSGGAVRERVNYKKVDFLVSIALGRPCCCRGLGKQELCLLAAVAWYGKTVDDRLYRLLDYMS